MDCAKTCSQLTDALAENARLRGALEYLISQDWLDLPEGVRAAVRKAEEVLYPSPYADALKEVCPVPDMPKVKDGE
jgi:hypothetical protein